MADKFRQTFPISISFSEGELPTASKMNGLATQARNGQGVIQYALGDLWNQGGDSLLSSTSTSENALMIPSLARYIGGARYTSPRIPYLANIQEYTYAFTSDAGAYEATLTFPPDSGAPAYTWSAVGGEPNNSVASRGLVVAAGDYYVDTDTGQIYTYDAINANWTLTYKPVVAGDISATATYNIIPDLDTNSSYAFQGVKIRYANGVDNSQGYEIWLPPRGPLNTRRTDRAPHDISGNYQTNPSGGSRTFWQSGAVAAPSTDATNAAHYRYVLPDAITGAAGWGSGTQLPRGFAYLWDSNNTGTVIEGVTLAAESAASPRTYLLIASGTSLDTWLTSSYGSLHYPDANLKSSSHASGYYPAAGLKLVIVGSDISQFVSELMAQFINHDHSDSHSMPAAPIKHGKLEDLFEPSGNTPELVASKLDNDGHPQYLHRGGFGAGTLRDTYRNGMMRDMLMMSSNSTSNYYNVDDDSRTLFFGQESRTAGGVVYFSPYDAATNADGLDRLVVYGNNSGNTAGGIRVGDAGYTNNTYLDIGYDTSTKYITVKTEQNNSNLYFQTDGGSAPLYVKTTGSSSDIFVTTEGEDSDIYISTEGVNETIFITAGSSAVAPPTTGGGYDSVVIRAGEDIYGRAFDDIVFQCAYDIPGGAGTAGTALSLGGGAQIACAGEIDLTTTGSDIDINADDDIYINAYDKFHLDSDTEDIVMYIGAVDREYMMPLIPLPHGTYRGGNSREFLESGWYAWDPSEYNFYGATRVLKTGPGMFYAAGQLPWNCEIDGAYLGIRQFDSGTNQRIEFGIRYIDYYNAELTAETSRDSGLFNYGDVVWHWHYFNLNGGNMYNPACLCRIALTAGEIEFRHAIRLEVEDCRNFGEWYSAYI